MRSAELPKKAATIRRCTLAAGLVLWLLATPAIARDSLIIRTATKLFRISKR